MLTAILVLAVARLSYCGREPIVKIPLGELEGHYLVSSGGNEYRAFEGVPFAKPPLGSRRFKDPEPVDPWSGRLVTNKFTQPCVNSRNILVTGRSVNGVEDCLYLNVYAPVRNQTNNLLPVIFYIYGGAFSFSVLFGTEQYYLIDHDVVFVAINYRHGPFGFLSTEDDVVSGNMGLKDQALALRWVSENIRYFGGDPKRVGIYGLSAGGQGVHFLYLSPLTAGLFQTGVSFSGTAFAPFAQAKESRAKAVKLGELLNCPTDDIRKMIDCLRERPAYDIAEAQTYFQPWLYTEFTPFGPVVEKKSAKNPFIDSSPIDIIRAGKAHPVPWITGVTKDEGLYPTAAFASNETTMEHLNKNWETIAPHLLNYYYMIPQKEHENVARKVRQYYFGDKPINKENLNILVGLLSDRLYYWDNVEAAQEQAKANRGPVWFYRYTYQAADSLTNFVSQTTEKFGVSHGDDVFLVLANPFMFPNKIAEDLNMHAAMIKFWLSIANTGTPLLFEPKWTKLDSKNRNFTYLNIAGPGDYKLETNNDFKHMKFWNSLGFNKNTRSSL